MTELLTAVPVTERAGLRTVRVAVAGCGTVGGELLALMQSQAQVIAAVHGARLEVTSVLVRDVARTRRVPLPAHIVTSDSAALLAAPADVVVEAMGGTGAALRVAHAVLSRGGHLVTANKALVAEHGEALERLARARGGSLRYEAAVAGGVPVIRVLRDGIAHDTVRSVRGILNGTTNYILTRMQAGESFADALAGAQAAGFAEADPSRDLDGLDAADKIRILARLAFGTWFAGPVAVRGLRPVPDALVAAAAAMGGTVRLLAEAVRVDGGVTASVEPVLVSRDSGFARAAGEENRVEVATEWTGRLVLQGPGAGGAPTASAVLGDVLDSCGRVASGSPARGALVQDPRAHDWVVGGKGQGFRVVSGVRRGEVDGEVVLRWDRG